MSFKKLSIGTAMILILPVVTYAYGGLDGYGTLGDYGGLYGPSYGDLERELDDIKNTLQDGNTQQLRLANDGVWNEALRVIANSSACTKDADQLIINVMKDSLDREGAPSILSPSAQRSIRESQRRNDMNRISQMLVLREEILRSCSSPAEKTNTACPEYSYFDGEFCNCIEGYEQDSTNTKCARKTNSVEEPKFPTSEKGLPSDVPSDAWYGDALNSFIEEGDVSSEENFRPQDKATRGEFITMLAGNSWDYRGIQSSFDDVPAWYKDAFEKAGKLGWVKGAGDCYGTHPCHAHPDNPINRAEAAALIIRAFSLEEGEEAPEFDDVPDDAWFRGSIRAAARHCILKGDQGKRSVRPSDNLNRAEMVVMINRASQRFQYPNCY